MISLVITMSDMILWRLFSLIGASLGFVVLLTLFSLMSFEFSPPRWRWKEVWMFFFAWFVG